MTSGSKLLQLLPRNGLLGSLPDAAFQGLSNLQYVDLSGGLSCWNSMQLLTLLHLRDHGAIRVISQETRWTEPLPPALAAAPNLILLHLGANNLAGGTPCVSA